MIGKIAKLRMTIILISITFLSVAVGHYVDKRPTTRLEKIKVYGGIVLALASVVVGILHAIQQDKDSQKMSELQTKVYDGNLKILTNQYSLGAQYRTLSDYIATNSAAIDWATRSNILEANKGFLVLNSEVVDRANWREDLNLRNELQKLRIQTEQDEANKRDLEAQKRFAGRWYTNLDYVVKRLERTLADVAKQEKDTLKSSYTSMPMPMPPAGSFITVAEFKMERNPGWDFRVVFERDSLAKKLRLVSASSATVTVVPSLSENGDRIQFTLEGANLHIPPVVATFSNFNATADQFVRDIIAQQDSQMQKSTTVK